METHRTLGKAGDDGVLHLDIPVGAPNSEFEVIIVLQPKTPRLDPRTSAGRRATSNRRLARSRTRPFTATTRGSSRNASSFE
jgi:hypothetical protein